MEEEEVASSVKGCAAVCVMPLGTELTVRALLMTADETETSSNNSLRSAVLCCCEKVY